MQEGVPPAGGFGLGSQAGVMAVSTALVAGENASARRNARNRLILDGAMRAYRERLRPLEHKSNFQFMHPLLTDAEFSATPSVLLVGQYSVGKTTFIRNLVGQDFGQRIGPEPTTDRFTAVFHGENCITPGNSLVMHTDKPYRALSKFGVGFLDKFEGSSCDSELLRHLTFIDTPGQPDIDTMALISNGQFD